MRSIRSSTHLSDPHRDDRARARRKSTTVVVGSLTCSRWSSVSLRRHSRIFITFHLLNKQRRPGTHRLLQHINCESSNVYLLTRLGVMWSEAPTVVRVTRGEGCFVEQTRASFRSANRVGEGRIGGSIAGLGGKTRRKPPGRCLALPRDGYREPCE